MINLSWNEFSSVQKNILFASIIADGEITKLYPKSRRKNNSYREHFSLEQLNYRRWKAHFLKELLYFRTNHSYLVSKSSTIFTELYPYFYKQNGQKRIPVELRLLYTPPISCCTLSR
ncbi:hypothetical protein [Neobacillus sp. D3-1R]|uniref:hypothetical protein n=1 Tax=Neobacillus sp. D3-1R TaxID=3445778 RepID=UPI003F9FDC01